MFHAYTCSELPSNSVRGVDVRLRVRSSATRGDAALSAAFCNRNEDEGTSARGRHVYHGDDAVVQTRAGWPDVR